ncbi:MAG: hypothetical protein AAB510_00070 [Patescibacteria group bacterium]
MRKFIHNIRRQSDETKRHILHGLTLFCACLLFVLWVYSLSGGLINEASEAEIQNEANPLSVLKDNITPLW